MTIDRVKIAASLLVLLLATTSFISQLVYPTVAQAGQGVYCAADSIIYYGCCWDTYINICLASWGVSVYEGFYQECMLVIGLPPTECQFYAGALAGAAVGEAADEAWQFCSDVSGLCL